MFLPYRKLICAMCLILCFMNSYYVILNHIFNLAYAGYNFRILQALTSYTFYGRALVIIKRDYKLFPRISRLVLYRVLVA